MATCAFFGTLTADNMNLASTSLLDSILQMFVEINGVKTFYTPAQTDFDFYGILSVLALKIKDKDIKVVKILGKDDVGKAQDPCFECVYLDSNEYRDRCIHASQLADIVLIDMPENPLYEAIKQANSERQKKLRIYDLKELIEIAYSIDDPN